MWTFEATVWLWTAENKVSWHFVTLPHDASDEIDDLTASTSTGFGSVPVMVTIGATAWRTSLFPSNEQKSFVLPLKKAVRVSEGFGNDDTVAVTVELA